MSKWCAALTTNPPYRYQQPAGTPAPTATLISPDIGDPAGGGLTRTVTGTGFNAGVSGVTAGGTACTSVVVVNDTTLTCIMPAHAAGLVDIVVTGPGGSGTLTNGYEFFAPSATNQTLRLKSTAGVTESSGAVSQWNDQSGAGRNFTQSTEANKPTYSATSFNGRPGITFDGSTDLLTSTAIVDDIIDDDGYTLYYVLKIATNASNDADSFDNAGILCETTANWGTHVKGTSSPFEVRAYHWTTVDENAGITLAANTAGVFTHAYDGTDLIARLNQGTADTEPAGNVVAGANGTLRIGKSYDTGAAYANVTLAEIIAYDAAHDASTRTKYQRYLQAEWGIA